MPFLFLSRSGRNAVAAKIRGKLMRAERHQGQYRATLMFILSVVSALSLMCFSIAIVGLRVFNFERILFAS